MNVCVFVFEGTMRMPTAYFVCEKCGISIRKSFRLNSKVSYNCLVSTDGMRKREGMGKGAFEYSFQPLFGIPINVVDS